METEKLQPYVEFASDVVKLSLNSNYDMNAVMNGLAVAAAAVLTDLAIADGKTIDKDVLQEAIELFIDTVYSAVDFAKEQFEDGNLISETDD